MQETVYLGRNNRAIRFTGTLLISLLLAFLIGFYIDQYMHTTPIGMLVLGTYAIVGNFIILIRSLHER